MSIRIREYDLYTDKIKKAKKILNISDVHSDVRNFNNVLNVVDSINPDFITIAGDLIDSTNNKENDKLLEMTKDFTDRYLTYLVLGNHDIVKLVKNKVRRVVKDIPFYNRLDSESNIHLLMNNTEVYNLGNDIQIIGLTLENKWYKKYREDKKMFKEILNDYLKKTKIDKNKFIILLLHSSNGLVDNNELMHIDGVNLVLCGHNHGGLTPEFIQKMSKKHIGLAGPYGKFFIKDAYGYWTNNDTSLILSNGVTKMGKIHAGKFIRTIVNDIYKCDAEVINLIPAKKHKLVLKSIKVHK